MSSSSGSSLATLLCRRGLAWGHLPHAQAGAMWAARDRGLLPMSMQRAAWSRTYASKEGDAPPEDDKTDPPGLMQKLWG
jgi:hypothetical protein